MFVVREQTLRRGLLREVNKPETQKSVSVLKTERSLESRTLNLTNNSCYSSTYVKLGVKQCGPLVKEAAEHNLV